MTIMRLPLTLLLLLAAATAAAQQRPIFEAEDFVEPRLHDEPVFIMRLVAGVVRNPIDDYRPLDDDAAFVQVVNNIYWSRFQFGYKHTELRGKTDTPPAFLCGCSERGYFPTPPLANQTPAAPPPGSKDMLQFGWYRSAARAGRDPLTLRYRLTWIRQPIDRTIRSAATGAIVSHLSGDEQSFGIDGDTHVRVAGRDFFGLLAYAATRRRGTIDDRTQHELIYTHRFPGIAINTVLLRTTLAVGGVSHRGGTAVNVVNPLVEAFWHERHTDVNFHVVWSPQTTRDGTGWQTHHQIALFADRALFVSLFKSEPRDRATE